MIALRLIGPSLIILVTFVSSTLTLAGCDELGDKEYLKQRLGDFYVDLDPQLEKLAETEKIVRLDALLHPGDGNRWQRLCFLSEYKLAGRHLSGKLAEYDRPLIHKLGNLYLDEGYEAWAFIGDDPGRDRITFFYFPSYGFVSQSGRKPDRSEIMENIRQAQEELARERGRELTQFERASIPCSDAEDFMIQVKTIILKGSQGEKDRKKLKLIVHSSQ